MIKVEIDTVDIPVKTEDEVKSHFKSLYLQVFNAKCVELDYDGMDTLTMWANKAGSVYEEEAKSILDWYEAIISYNYALINSGTVPTDEEYISNMPKLGA